MGYMGYYRILYDTIGYYGYIWYYRILYNSMRYHGYIWYSMILYADIILKIFLSFWVKYKNTQFSKKLHFSFYMTIKIIIFLF